MDPLTVVKDVLGALVAAVGPEGVIALVQDIAKAKNSPEEIAAATAAAEATTDAVVDVEEAQKLETIAGQVKP